MTAIIFGIVLMSILVAVVVLVFKPYDYGASVTRFKKIADSNDSSDLAANTRWRSVKIRPGLNPCKRVASLGDQVFLSRDAPELPLPNCTERDCRCHYVFLDDRRGGVDRRAEPKQLHDTERDRRRRPGRRMDDLVPA
jgi:hypothetical protein